METLMVVNLKCNNHEARPFQLNNYYDPTHRWRPTKPAFATGSKKLKNFPEQFLATM